MNSHMTVSMVNLLISKGIAYYIITAVVKKIPVTTFLQLKVKQDYFVKI